MQKYSSYILLPAVIALLLVSACTRTGVAGHVITKEKDTIYGAVWLNPWAYKDALSVRNTDGKQQFHYGEILEYRRHGVDVIIRETTNSRGRKVYDELAATERGKISLLWDLYYVRVLQLYFLIDGEYVASTRNNLTHFVWPYLNKCTAFVVQYGYIDAEEFGKWHNRETQLADIVRFYNENCCPD